MTITPIATLSPNPANFYMTLTIFHTKRMSKKTVTKRFTKGKGSGKIE